MTRQEKKSGMRRVLSFDEPWDSFVILDTSEAHKSLNCSSVCLDLTSSDLYDTLNLMISHLSRGNSSVNECL